MADELPLENLLYPSFLVPKHCIKW